MERQTSGPARLFTALLVLGAAALPAAASGPEGREPMLVVLKGTAASAGPFVRLAEIAELPNDPHRLRRRAGEIFLGFAPRSGEVREIDSAEVAARLKEAGLAEDRFQVKGAPRVSVFTGEGPPGEGSGSPSRAGQTPAAGSSRGPASGPRPSSPRSQPARPQTPASRVSGGAESPARASGPGGPPAASDPPLLVEKGVTVTIRTRGQALVMEEPGRALSSGAEGELVEVQNLRTGRKVMARISGSGVVVPAERTAEGQGE
jgi:hypothetical protein